MEVGVVCGDRKGCRTNIGPPALRFPNPGLKKWAALEVVVTTMINLLSAEGAVGQATLKGKGEKALGLWI